MFSRIRTRFTYANIVATLALVFAMSGGALAASKFLITSTKQIKPSVIASLKGKAGPAGAEGATGPQGSAGAKGDAGLAGSVGPAGPQGPEGKTGPQGEKGNEGEQGSPGEPWTAGGVLPAGRTETGTFTYLTEATPAEDRVMVPISFPIPLKTALGATATHWVTSSTPPECGKGNAAAPTAEPGNLCIYVVFKEGIIKPFSKNTDEEVSINPSEPQLAPGVGTTGALLDLSIEEPANRVYGTWAVTAPEG